MLNPKITKLLLAGEYICSVRYGAEYRELEVAATYEAANDWLQGAGMRMARLGEEGAFFATHEAISAREITQVKNDFLNFRDTYGPFVLMLEHIRQSCAGSKYLVPGEYLRVYELEEEVNNSSVLTSNLKSLLTIISNASTKFSNHENIKRMLEHLTKDGYLIVADKDSSTYQITGKIDQLYLVLQYMKDQAVIPDQDIDASQMEPTEDLFSQAGAEG